MTKKPTSSAKPQPSAEAMTQAQRFQKALMDLATLVVAGKAGKVHRIRKPRDD